MIFDTQHFNKLKQWEQAKKLFESILCLRVEGIEFFSSTEILDAIQGEATKGYNMCKKATDAVPKEESLYCQCGHPIRVIHNEFGRACRTDGLRLVDAEKEDTGWCLFRCPSCKIVIKKDSLVELGNL